MIANIRARVDRHGRRKGRATVAQELFDEKL
jgi:hypothetical protein